MNTVSPAIYPIETPARVAVNTMPVVRPGVIVDHAIVKGTLEAVINASIHVPYARRVSLNSTVRVGSCSESRRSCASRDAHFHECLVQP